MYDDCGVCRGEKYNSEQEVVNAAKLAGYRPKKIIWVEDKLGMPGCSYEYY